MFNHLWLRVQGQKLWVCYVIDCNQTDLLIDCNIIYSSHSFIYRVHWTELQSHWSWSDNDILSGKTSKIFSSAINNRRKFPVDFWRTWILRYIILKRSFNCLLSAVYCQQQNHRCKQPILYREVQTLPQKSSRYRIWCEWGDVLNWPAFHWVHILRPSPQLRGVNGDRNNWCWLTTIRDWQ